jgi:hypothetical protein
MLNLYCENFPGWIFGKTIWKGGKTMDWKVVFVCIIVAILGMIAGYNLALMRIRSNTLGAIRIDRSDPDEDPYLFLELKGHPDALMNEQYVIFEVKNENFVSPK